MNPRVKAVDVLENYKLRITFKNDEVRIFDVEPYFELPVFKMLRDSPNFYNIKVAHGTVVWAGDIDLCPDTIYLESVPM